MHSNSTITQLYRACKLLRTCLTFAQATTVSVKIAQVEKEKYNYFVDRFTFVRNYKTSFVGGRKRDVCVCFSVYMVKEYYGT